MFDDTGLLAMADSSWSLARYPCGSEISGRIWNFLPERHVVFAVSCGAGRLPLACLHFGDHAQVPSGVAWRRRPLGPDWNGG